MLAHICGGLSGGKLELGFAEFESSSLSNCGENVVHRDKVTLETIDIMFATSSIIALITHCVIVFSVLSSPCTILAMHSILDLEDFASVSDVVEVDCVCAVQHRRCFLMGLLTETY